MMENYWTGKQEYSIKLTRKKAWEWQQIVLKNNPDLGVRREEIISNLPLPDQPEYWNFSDFSGGSFLIVTHAPPTPEALDLLRRSAKIFDLAYRRYLDLKKAEAQIREAQIEASLERVRAASMAMHTSNELFNVINILSHQLVQLGIHMDSAMINEVVEGSKDWYMWLAIPSDTKEVYTHSDQIHVPYIKSAAFDRINRSRKKGETVLSDQLTKAQKDLIFNHYFKNSNHRDVPQARQDYILSAPGLCRTTILSRNSYIQFFRYSLQPFSEEENQVLVRFGNVFEQSHTRFLDLQKAEAQAREAQIEAALERVRARSMAMHTTEEILDVVVVLFNQLRGLNVDFIQAWISIWHLDDGYMELWLSPIEGHGELPIYHKRPSAQFEDTTVKTWLKGDRFSYLSLPGEETVTEFLIGTDQIMGGDYFKKLQHKNRYNRLEFVDANHKYGTVSMSWNAEIPENDKNILSRFSQVFEQTYTRFLDLEKAEAQAREAQIEAALERVRSKTMAMHNSQDVGDTVITLFNEVINLGLDKTIRCGIGILEGYEGMETWSANSDQKGDVNLKMGMLNMTIHPMLAGLKKAWKNGKKGYSYNFIGKDVTRYYTALNNEPEYPFQVDLSTLPDNQFSNMFFFTEGILFAFAHNPLTDEAKRVLERFANVFGQTYRRYLDLQKAEAQVREAEIQLSLERIRARAMAMQESSELTEVLSVIFQQLKMLGVETIWTHLTLLHQEENAFTYRMTGRNGKRIMAEEKIDFRRIFDSPPEPS